MSKSVYAIVCTVVLALAATACSDYLDITPDGQSKRTDQLSTQKGVEEAMYGVYAQLRQPSLYGKELSYSALDVMAQYFQSYGNTKVNALLDYNYSHSTLRSLFQAAWTAMYANISNANSVLNSPLVADATDYPYKIYRGEALALRAMMHFDLLRIFAPQVTVAPDASGIPYATAFSLQTPEMLTANQVYDHIVSDLTTAEQLLADEAAYEGLSPYMTMRQTHLNIHAVRALLARVLLTRGHREQALSYARQVIAESGRTLLGRNELTGAYAGVLSQSETLFGIYSATDFYETVYQDLWLATSFYSLNPTDDYQAIYDTGGATDYRLTAYYETQMTGTVRFVKLLDKYKVEGRESQRPGQMVTGINMIRLPEMYYIVAECLALGGDTEGAVKALNTVLTARGRDALAGQPTAAAIVSEVNADRRRELVGEGQQFFNMKRQNLPITTLRGAQVAPTDAVYVVPIPDIEFDYRN